MKEYGSESIQVLTDLEHMRLRRGMYIGEATDPHQLLSEIFDNAIDEVQAGFSKELIVTIDTIQNKYSVRDFGRGIPHGKKTLDNGQEKEILEILITKANSGGKFNNASYNFSCLTGDTQIKLADGRIITFEALLDEFNNGVENFCYSCDSEGNVTIEKILNVQKTKEVNQLIKITLNNGKIIECTPDHKFLFRDGTFIEAKDLKIDDSLMAGTFGNTSDIFKDYDCIQNNKTNKDEMIKLAENYNHFITNIETIYTKVPISVYDLTVSGDAHTFLLDAGVFVHNCGLNGLGLTITNALSNEIHLVSYRKGKYVEAKAYGTDQVSITYGKTEEPDGTLVEFIPNPKMFHNKKIPSDFIKDRCKIASALGFRARLIIDNEEVNTNSGIFDLIKEESSNINTYVNIQPIEVIALNAEKMKVALRYTSDTSDRYFGYTNLLNNYLGGTHVQELSKTIINSWKEFLEKHKNIRPNVELHNNDYLVGLRAICAVFISKPEFSSQTKEKLVVNKKYFEELMSLFSKRFTKYLEENILIAQQLIKRFEEYRIAQNNLLSRKEISSLIKVNNDSEDSIRRRSVVSKLVECTSKRRKDTELFIVEGDSAKGPYMFTRNKELQAVLPLRGKILNVTFKSLKEAVKNAEICDIANSMGCGIGTACDANKSRYDKIIISADADIDGAHITCLIASVFINLFPDMVKQGRVYITLPPLYCWGNNVKNYGWCNSPDEIPKGVTVTRFKGLGEMNNDQLKYFLVDPNTRREMRLDYPSDIDEFNRILGSAQGKHELLEEFGILCRGE